MADVLSHETRLDRVETLKLHWNSHLDPLDPIEVTIWRNILECFAQKP